MKMTYDAVATFFKNYFSDFTNYAQDIKTQERMNDYFAPELKVHAYVNGHQKRGMSRDFFYKRLIHPDVHEKLTIGQLIIDEKHKIADILVRSEARHTVTGELRWLAWMNVIYFLKLDQTKTIKIKKIYIFTESIPQVFVLDDLFNPRT
jgi:hypothetical protein